MPLILNEKARFDAMVQIASGLIARSHLSPNEIAVEVDAYLRDSQFRKQSSASDKRTLTSAEITSLRLPSRSSVCAFRQGS